MIRARLWASDGTTAEATVRTVPLIGVERASVLLVEVYVTVRSDEGEFVTDLEAADFKVTEDGAPQSLSLFTSERTRMSRSGSTMWIRPWLIVSTTSGRTSTPKR